ncbi:hypothetical protein LOTGIDRAFT_154406 [Lottia gigantea]|uniref:Methyltransferase domain-containing protein n=1 Tax=Lottia gigantea TaxID=225164 RepID=V4A7N6_LOTGI|nr:hypothetical protein LOTGIDRAFT_154406 [Lottia gigantea]ESO89306.1 hypothetical protein LOTGIDRAFT_154406 [Lottia gigantea]
MSTIHKTAVVGFTKGDLYESSRPSYTDLTVERIIEEFQNLGQGQEVKYDIVELGAGTGKFTNLITKKLRNVRYLATEPSDGFYQTFQELYPYIESLQCTASKIPLKNHSVKDLDLDGVEFGGNIKFLVQNIMSVSVVNALSEENKQKLGEKVYQFLYKVHGDTEFIKIPFKTKIVIYKVK